MVILNIEFLGARTEVFRKSPRHPLRFMCAEYQHTSHMWQTKVQDNNRAITCRSVAKLTRSQLAHPTSPNHPVTPAKPTHIPATAAMNCLNQWTHTGKSSNVSCGQQQKPEWQRRGGDGSSRGSRSVVNILEPLEQEVNRNHLGGNKHEPSGSTSTTRHSPNHHGENEQGGLVNLLFGATYAMRLVLVCPPLLMNTPPKMFTLFFCAP